MVLAHLSLAFATWRYRRRRVRALTNALAQISLELRTVYIMSAAQKLPHDEIARQIGITPQHVDNLLAQALTELAFHMPDNEPPGGWQDHAARYLDRLLTARHDDR